MLKKSLAIVFLVLSSSFPVLSNPLLDSIVTNRKSKFIALPLAFYSIETKLGFGASGIYTFYGKKDSTERPSNIQFGAAYTLRNQVLFYAPFQLFFDNEKYLITGETGYYVYNYFFHGVGNSNPKEYVETYDVTFPRLRINVMKQIYPQLFAGIRYSFDNFKITKRETGKLLSENIIAGSKGGATSGIGLVVRFDKRDNIFSPTKGIFTDFFTQIDKNWTGSQFDFQKYSLDFSTYFSNKFNHTLALNFYSVANFGNPPFYQMALIGGTKKLRGFYEGRYRDKNVAIFQAEYRVPIVGRLGAVAFAGTGLVADKIKNYQLKNLRTSYGGGLRIMLDKVQKINLRLDYGIGEKKGNFYFTITEAF
jgi:Omp85 superfamily domain